MDIDVCSYLIHKRVESPRRRGVTLRQVEDRARARSDRNPIQPKQGRGAQGVTRPAVTCLLGG